MYEAGTVNGEGSQGPSDDSIGSKGLFQRLIHPSPLLLVSGDQILKHNLRKEFLTENELKAMLRQQEVDEISDVKEAYMEGDGKISVIKNDKRRHSADETNVK